MAKGLEQHRRRQQEISLLGKDLARRANKKCELCESSGSLRPYDTEPESEPQLSTLALLCDRCRDVIGGRKEDPRTLRFLETAVWNEQPQIAALAKAMLAKVDADWARECLAMF